MTIGDVLANKLGAKSDQPKKRWSGPIPTRCQVCGGTIGKVFYDFPVHGTWALGCHSCWQVHGHGLGVGRGQKYSSTDGAQIEPKGKEAKQRDWRMDAPEEEL